MRNLPEVLTIKQVNKLKNNLGMTLSDATMHYDINGNLCIGYDSDDNSQIPTYTCGDLISHLPIWVKDNNYKYRLMIHNSCVYYEDLQSYPDTESLVGFYFGKDFGNVKKIDALFDLLVYISQFESINEL